mmetsp:Transcript_12858/g.31341  ORF Transcript_12858/g.31341 Transcript_12858/m.31341 type:complete len:220 (+) Transcript_12858:315-974(+)
MLQGRPAHPDRGGHCHLQQIARPLAEGTTLPRRSGGDRQPRRHRRPAFAGSHDLPPRGVVLLLSDRARDVLPVGTGGAQLPGGGGRDSDSDPSHQICSGVAREYPKTAHEGPRRPRGTQQRDSGGDEGHQDPGVGGELSCKAGGAEGSGIGPPVQVFHRRRDVGNHVLHDASPDRALDVRGVHAERERAGSGGGADGAGTVRHHQVPHVHAAPDRQQDR